MRFILVNADAREYDSVLLRLEEEDLLDLKDCPADGLRVAVSQEVDSNS